jgi:hypothetical protein
LDLETDGSIATTCKHGTGHINNNSTRVIRYGTSVFPGCTTLIDTGTSFISQSTDVFYHCCTL